MQNNTNHVHSKRSTVILEYDTQIWRQAAQFYVLEKVQINIGDSKEMIK